jgi:hypothetical protein
MLATITFSAGVDRRSCLAPQLAHSTAALTFQWSSAAFRCR